MKVAGIIPARYASSRFPGKPLVDIAGKTLIMRVYEQAKKVRSINEVIVATDDCRIFEHVRQSGGTAEMTHNRHRSGTERIAEVARKLNGYDLVVNIQGDEPFADPGSIDSLICHFRTNPATQIATLAHPVKEMAGIRNENLVKVVFDQSGRALYFSRAVIPYLRNPESEGPVVGYYRHLGIYAFRPAALERIVRLPESALEQAESLEQLRWLDHGFQIRVVLCEAAHLAVDTPEDLVKLNHWIAENPHILK